MKYTGMRYPFYNKIHCDRIKPCPFCGAAADIYDYKFSETSFFKKVVCCSNEDCPMDMPSEGFYRPTKREALAEWNRRT